MAFTPSIVHSDGAPSTGLSDAEDAFPNLIADTRAAEAAMGFPQDPQIFKIATGSMALRLHRDWVADLQAAIFNADLSDPAEFHALFSLITGFGLSQASLAAELGKTENTVSRYVTGVSCPPDSSARRGVLIDAYRHLQNAMVSGLLPLTKFYQKPAAARSLVEV